MARKKVIKNKNFVVTLIGLFILLASLVVISQVIGEKTNLENKAATNCGSQIAESQCNTLKGCYWKSSGNCSNFNTSNCPTNSGYCKVVEKSEKCEGLGLTKCQQNVSLGCIYQDKKDQCLGRITSNNSYCSKFNNNYSGCSNETLCKWSASWYTGCSGTYSVGQKCVDSEYVSPSSPGDGTIYKCTTCKVTCVPNKTTCTTSGEIETCASNGCGISSRTKCVKSCHSADAYNETAYCLP